MFKKLSSLVVMTALLSTTSLYAHFPSKESETLYDKGTHLAAGAFHRTVSNPISQETKWWGDFEKSGKGLVSYIDEVASQKPEAAMWFLVTGGKYGFSAIKATSEEEAAILSAMQKVARSFASSDNKKEGYENWIGMETAHQAGHLHLKMIYNQIDELKKANESLNLRVGGLEREIGDLKGKNGVLEERILGLQKKNTDLEERLSKTEAKNQSLEEKLDEARKESIEQQKAFMAEMINQREQTNAVMKELAKQRESFFEEQRKEREAFQAQMMGLTSGNTHLATLFGDYGKTADERIERHLKKSDEEMKSLKEKNDVLTETLIKREQKDKEFDEAFSRINKSLEPIFNIERVSDKSLDLNFYMVSLLKDLQGLMSLRNR